MGARSSQSLAQNDYLVIFVFNEVVFEIFTEEAHVKLLTNLCLTNKIWGTE